ncbi:MAG TPA: hypothetical protein VEY13_15725 [Rubrobacteraceae bacterium]|nr:hypothetical protein [Rubrobacteraceae bacterium]
MIRRAQLLGPGSRAANRVLAAGERIRDGLLRDNKVVPALLALLALLIFAWILTGALMGGEPDETGTGQVATQASQPQAAQDSESEGPETPAPGVENRDTDSYSAFEKKDPFGNIGVEKSDDDGGNGGSGGGSAGENTTGASNGDSDSNNGSGSSRNDGPSPRGPDIRDSGGSGGDRRSGDAERSSGGGDDGQGGAGQGGTGQGGAAGSGGSNNGLFDSGGDLAFP